MSQPPQPFQPPMGNAPHQGFPPGAPPPFPGGVPPAGFPAGGPPPPFPPNGPFPGPAPVGFPVNTGPFPAGAPPAAPAPVNGIPASKQNLNTTPSRTVYISNLNEKVKIDGKLMITRSPTKY